MQYQMLFCDMDNTLLNKNLEISTEDKGAIQKAVKKGLKFVICTGRGIYGIERYIQELGLDQCEGYAICQNGGTVYRLPEGNLILERPFAAENFYPVAESAHKHKVDIQMYYDRILMAEELTPRIAKYQKIMGTTITIVPDVFEYHGKLTKCLLNGKKESLEKVIDEVKDKIPELNMFYSNREFLEFTAQEAHKGNAMLALAQSMNIPKEAIISVGDSDNDASMIAEAGMGIAVANASPQVKQIANYITKADCDHSAVKEVIDLFYL